MSDGEETELCYPSLLPGDGSAPRPRKGQIVRLVSRRVQSSIAHISVHGHVDASNTAGLVEYTLERATHCRELILDLRGLEFFGAEGFSALHRISVNCARLGTSWAIVPGVAAHRVLGICDPDSSLPLADIVTTALATCTVQRGCQSRLIAAGTNIIG